MSFEKTQLKLPLYEKVEPFSVKETAHDIKNILLNVFTMAQLQVKSTYFVITVIINFISLDTNQQDDLYHQVFVDVEVDVTTQVPERLLHLAPETPRKLVKYFDISFHNNYDDNSHHSSEKILELNLINILTFIASKSKITSVDCRIEGEVLCISTDRLKPDLLFYDEYNKNTIKKSISEIVRKYNDRINKHNTDQVVYKVNNAFTKLEHSVILSTQSIYHVIHIIHTCRTKDVQIVARNLNWRTVYLFDIYLIQFPNNSVALLFVSFYKHIDVEAIKTKFYNLYKDHTNHMLIPSTILYVEEFEFDQLSPIIDSYLKLLDLKVIYRYHDAQTSYLAQYVDIQKALKSLQEPTSTDSNIFTDEQILDFFLKDCPVHEDLQVFVIKFQDGSFGFFYLMLNDNPSLWTKVETSCADMFVKKHELSSIKYTIWEYMEKGQFDYDVNKSRIFRFTKSYTLIKDIVHDMNAKVFTLLDEAYLLRVNTNVIHDMIKQVNSYSKRFKHYQASLTGNDVFTMIKGFKNGFLESALDGLKDVFLVKTKEGALVFIHVIVSVDDKTTSEIQKQFMYDVFLKHFCKQSVPVADVQYISHICLPFDYEKVLEPIFRGINWTIVYKTANQPKKKMQEIVHRHTLTNEPHQISKSLYAAYVPSHELNISIIYYFVHKEQIIDELLDRAILVMSEHMKLLNKNEHISLYSEYVYVFHGTSQLIHTHDLFVCYTFVSTTRSLNTSFKYAGDHGVIYIIRIPPKFPFLNLQDQLDQIILPMGTHILVEEVLIHSQKTYVFCNVLPYQSEVGNMILDVLKSKCYTKKDDLTLQRIRSRSKRPHVLDPIIFEGPFDSLITKKRMDIGSSSFFQAKIRNKNVILKDIVKKDDKVRANKNRDQVFIRILNEIIASKIYSHVYGLHTMKYFLYQVDDPIVNTQFVSPYLIGSDEIVINYKPAIMTQEWKDQQWNEQMLEGFLVDCILANWDVLNNRNWGVYKNKIIRTDVGGALKYRGKGDTKIQFPNVRIAPHDHIDIASQTSFKKLISDISEEECKNRIMIGHKNLILENDIHPKLQEVATYFRDIVIKKIKSKEDKTFYHKFVNEICNTILYRHEYYKKMLASVIENVINIAYKGMDVQTKPYNFTSMLPLNVSGGGKHSSRSRRYSRHLHSSSSSSAASSSPSTQNKKYSNIYVYTNDKDTFFKDLHALQSCNDTKKDKTVIKKRLTDRMTVRSIVK